MRWKWWKKEIAAPEPVKEPEKAEMKIKLEAVADIQAKPPREFQQ